MKKIATLCICLISLFICHEATACTNFIITKGASKDGSCMVSYAADSHTLYGELYYRPARLATAVANPMMDVIEWDSGKLLGQIPDVETTYSVVGNMNEHQLTIAETTYGGLPMLWEPNGIIDYGTLIYTTLQRAKNAREAIATISYLLDTYGYCSEGESFSIVDPDEAWIMELIGKGRPITDGKGNTVAEGWTKGAVWVARRIPDGYISGHANQARITTFPLADGKKSITNKQLDKIKNPSVETVYSWDVISFARLAGLYDKKAKDADFSFCDVYAPLDFSGARACEARVWCAFYRCNPELMRPYESYARGEDLKSKVKLPLWIKPDHLLSVQDVMELMRDHFEGTSMDMTKDIGAGPFSCPYRWRPMNWEYNGKKYIHERATATQQTGFSFVAQMRSWLPDKVGGVLWFGVDDAASCCYMPIFCGVTRIPMELQEGNGSIVDYSPTAAYWKFTKVSNFAYSRYKDMIVPIKEKQHELESRAVEEVNRLTDEIKADFVGNDADVAAALGRMNEYCSRNVSEVCHEWEHLFEYLLVKFNDGNIKKEKDGKFLKTDTKIPQAEFPDQPEYPEFWYRIIVDDCGNNIQER